MITSKTTADARVRQLKNRVDAFDSEPSTSPEERKRNADAAAEADAAAFPWRPGDDDMKADALSLSWERARRNGHPWGLVKWTTFRELRWGGADNLFRNDARCCLSTHRRFNPKLNDGPRRNPFRDACAPSKEANPFRAAEVGIDVEEWMTHHLSERQVLIGLRLLEGYSHGEIAKEIGVSRQLVQLETEHIRNSWRHYVSLADLPVKG